MSYDDDSYAEQRRRRENIMQQRLRKSRGEEIDEDLHVGLYGDDDDDGVPRTFGRVDPLPRRSGPARGGGGCATAVLYLVLGGLAALLVVVFLFNQTASGIGSLFAGVPNLATIIVTPTPVIQSGAAVVQRIQQLSRLETAQYTVEQVIDVRQDSNVPIVGNLLAGDALLLIAHGTVVAGVDLSTLNAGAVTISPDGRTITLRIPPAEVFSSALDSSKTRVYSRDRGVFAPDNKDLETQARLEAERRILQAACEDGVMSRATDAAEISLQKFLSLLDYDEVVVIPSAPAACAAPAGGPQATPAP
ncbi:DUF4230 domain-containing protein [Oscillochloris sp. ZM17-4]|uniref:DUF4230 domain-containing protein n=1 Tax=Oscillochloris sp. ZM17-4 TaxID=2866714 RepID=UPI001C72CA9E|nr:DUF4230 domain-containing protein [Oscillochloris sp. ZM17-4]MBX0329281.1 DUF4230 domain-containing protein [Oscillochloris sp. ZM17-4]